MHTLHSYASELVPLGKDVNQTTINTDNKKYIIRKEFLETSMTTINKINEERKVSDGKHLLFDIKRVQCLLVLENKLSN